MKFKQTTFGAALLVTICGFAAYAFAEPDYARIKKDINVMIGIVKSSFKNSDECKSCQVKISGHYLADQGVVFNVAPSGSYQYFSHYDDGLATSVISLRGVVEDIIAEVPVAPAPPVPPDVDVFVEESDGTFWDWDWDWDSRYDHESAEASREAREEMREAKQELRELAREMRGLSLEAIHASEEDLQELEAREAELQAELERRENVLDEIQQKISEASEKQREKHRIRLVKRQEQQEQRFAQVESIVLEAFCDYSSTMRNLPNDERVSIIVNKSEGGSNIYVFEQDKLIDCDSSKGDIKQHALSYAF